MYQTELISYFSGTLSRQKTNSQTDQRNRKTMFFISYGHYILNFNRDATYKYIPNWYLTSKDVCIYPSQQQLSTLLTLI